MAGDGRGRRDQRGERLGPPDRADRGPALQGGRGARPQGRVGTRLAAPCAFRGRRAGGDPLAQVQEVRDKDARSQVPILILLFHVQDDAVVPFSHSQGMAAALRKAGKPVDVVLLRGGDHAPQRGDTRQGALNAVVTFLEKHNPPN